MRLPLVEDDANRPSGVLDLLGDVERVLPLLGSDEIPAAAGKIRELEVRLGLQLQGRPEPAQPAPQPEPERLLTAEQVAERLGHSLDWVRRHKAQIGGLAKGHRELRFREAVVVRYIRRITN